MCNRLQKSNEKRQCFVLTISAPAVESPVVHLNHDGTDDVQKWNLLCLSKVPPLHESRPVNHFQHKGRDPMPDTTTTPHQAPRTRLIPIPDVESLTGYKKTTIYLMLRQGKFPKPVRLSARAVRWSESAVLEWVQAQIDAR